RGVSMHTVVLGTLGINGDRARLGAALSNVLINALKYSPHGADVRIAAKPSGSGVRILVDDRGPGVPSELRERVFEKYFRVEHTLPRATDRAHGAGIGLYLCRQIVEAHGGTARCEPSPDGGARFVIELPSTRPRTALQ